MALKTFKPNTPSNRYKEWNSFEEITKDKPDRALTVALRKSCGRNNTGRITCRHIGGGAVRRYRLIDFKRERRDEAAKVIAIEYDPNRSARIALLTYADGEKRYIIAPVGLKVGQQLMSGPQAEVRVGNALPLRNIPLGTVVHNVELQPGRGGQMARSAGVGAQLLAKEGDYAQLRLPSGEVRRVQMVCLATIGQVGNTDHANLNLGKAGRKRWLGIRPGTRGIAMDPGSHPHGGGEGRSPVGMKAPKTPWGKPALGKKTRVNKRTNKFIVRRRSAAK